ncbi:glycine zipper 2TM domain-containing protein [Caenimonas sedimenti]|uniref:Glycine zipper 2TM domain-containing protein n=1 Tax=Caenimonas sedimenti TaxID=2596921 RepID=A0A562ZX63_9BURK|nr:glycine zipper 2TM domain-containing protein [Caenimonas sedimenti]TWO73199.1 glycine zipper 2TM domain-containing protein [Caenimonas sedimenti]
MRQISRLPALVTGAVMVSMLAACANPTMPVSQTYPSYPNSTYPVAGVEYGRIVNIEYLPVGTTAPRSSGILGAVVGGVAGAALGSLIGGGTGRTAATVLGGVAGAAVGNNIARNNQGVTTAPGYRITMQSDQGVTRTYEVPATGDLQVGDRVRIDGGVIYRA